MDQNETTNGPDGTDDDSAKECPDHMSPWTVVFIVLMAYLVLFVIVLIFFLLKRIFFGKPKKKIIRRVWNHRRYQHYLHPYCHRSIHTGHPCHHHSVDGTSEGTSKQGSPGQLTPDVHKGPYPKTVPIDAQKLPQTSNKVPSGGGQSIKPAGTPNQQPADGGKVKEDAATDKGQKEPADKGQSKNNFVGRTESEQSIAESDRFRTGRNRGQPSNSGTSTGPKGQMGTRDVPTRTHPLLSSVNYKKNSDRDKDDVHKGPYPKIDPIN